MKKRPINLDLTTLKIPLTAKTSILHRISGVFLFLCIPGLLYLLSNSLKSGTHFTNIQNGFSSAPAKLLLLIFSAAFIYHLLAGCRHLIMDVGIGETLQAARASAYLVAILTIISLIGIGVCLW